MQPSDRLKVPEPVFPDNCPTAVRVRPFPAPTECRVPSGSTCPPPPLTKIFPPIIFAPTVPELGHPAPVNVHTPSKFWLSPCGIAGGGSSTGLSALSPGSERNASRMPAATASLSRDPARASDGANANANAAHHNAAVHRDFCSRSVKAGLFGKGCLAPDIIADENADRKPPITLSAGASRFRTAAIASCGALIGCCPWSRPAAARACSARQCPRAARYFPAGAGWSGPGSNSRIAGSGSRSRAASHR
jgi:hypothetical protein